ncbi:LytR family transcriptional regulator [Candidatus Saccharibacteria bacterium]|nr:LytR family transcriptional regulator [Candidatus Saccharibacteria bacterium]
MSKRPSVDGFIPRRSPGMIGEHHVEDRRLPQPDASGLVRHPVLAPTDDNEARVTNALVPSGEGLGRPLTTDRSEIDESLHEIDTSIPDEKKNRQRERGGKKRRSKRWKRWIVILLVIGVVVFVGWFALKALSAGSAVFNGDIFGLVQQKELQQDEMGRSNVLIVGTSEDDPGHPGAYLTDSIMILSIDQKNKNAYMISIPRDLEVRYGRACNSEYAGKINEFFNCVNGDWESEDAEQERLTESRKFFGEVVGLDIQYAVHVNYSVMRDVVSALDGITVTIESPDPRGQMDGNFDWKCGATYAERMSNCPPRGHFIDYPNGPVELDAEHALYLAQARGDSPVNWGFPNSNFEREKNQQKILVAIKEKALSTGTLTNVGKVTGLIDALGDNLRTNFDTSEIRTLMALGQDIPESSIQSISLIDNELVSGNAQPTAGLYNFTQIRAFIKKKLNSSPLAKEAAHVIVLNASGIAGIAQSEADLLTALGMEIDQIGNAPEGDQYTANVIYQLDPKKELPLTLKKLTEKYSATVQTTNPPITPSDTTDFVVVIVSPPLSPSDSID